MSNARTLGDIIGAAGTPVISSNASFSANVAVTGAATFSNTVTVNSLTSSRVPYAGTSGLLQDSTNLTFSGNSLTVKTSGTAGTYQAPLSIQSTSPSYGAAIQMYDGTNDGYISWYNQGLYFAGTGGTTRMLIDSSGNHLIGTTSQANNVTAQLTIKTNDYTKPAIQIMGSDSNWWGRMSHSVSGGTQGTFISSGGAWSVTGTTYSATKDYDGSFPTTAAFVSSQWNSTQASSFAVLTKAGGSTKTDGTVSTLLGIDTSGRVTMPFQPAFSTYNPTGYTVNNTVTKITTWSTSYNNNFNTGSYFNTSTGRFTAPIAGRYFFTASMLPTASTGVNNLWFYVNGSNPSGFLFGYSNGSGTRQTLTQTVIFNLNVGDYVEVYINSSTTNSWDNSGNFSGYLIG